MQVIEMALGRKGKPLKVCPQKITSKPIWVFKKSVSNRRVVVKLDHLYYSCADSPKRSSFVENFQGCGNAPDVHCNVRMSLNLC